MKVSSIPALARTFAFLVVLGGLGACAGGLESNPGQGGSSGQSGGAGGTAGSASCGPAATGGSSGVATFSDVKTVVGFYCGGGTCHNSGQTPNFFPDNDTALYATLTTDKDAKSGGGPLGQTTAPPPRPLP